MAGREQLTKAKPRFTKEDLDPDMYVLLKVCTRITIDDPFELTIRQLTFFLQVYCSPNTLTTKELTDRLKLHRPGISRCGDKLQEYDLLRKATDPRDGRNIIIVKTPAGEEMFARFNKYISGSMPAATKGAN